MNDLQPYPKYKATKLEWLEKVPLNWELKKVKYQIENLDYKRIPLSADYRGKMLNKKFPYYGASGIIDEVDDYLFDETLILIGEDGANLFSRSTPLAFLAKGKYWVNNHAHILKPRNGNIIFFVNLLESIDYSLYVTGSAQPKLTQDAIANVWIPVPPLNEQNKIAEFIIDKTSEIDVLIADKERLIALLEEKRQAVITETVTKGLDPNVKMKDSGIGWIGEVPKHWEIVKIKHLSEYNLIYGANESAEFDDKNLPRYIRITDIDKDGNLKEGTFKSLPLQIASRYPVEKGDLLFARSGASVGKTYLHEIDDLACYAGYLIKYRSNKQKLNPKFLYYYTNSYSYKEWIQASTVQATIENVSAEKYGNMQVPYPNIEEQTRIVNLLEGYIKSDQFLINEIESQISKLKEYRESLIYEAVTGKIDVRDYTAEKEEIY